ncbi:hypothetical protein CC78DRAFT_161821 [Lojkania enalia]|uniref:Uncharacterized protein n=1 Tax=Lojkania enalia TaxID=147567 RepID=A0A9P4KGX8_9PLEO|nr:hypothetical protein CC78DRAFT_161821 [Didymosphaeria enalia]
MYTAMVLAFIALGGDLNSRLGSVRSHPVVAQTTFCPALLMPQICRGERDERIVAGDEIHESGSLGVRDRVADQPLGGSLGLPGCRIGRHPRAIGIQDFSNQAQITRASQRLLRVLPPLPLEFIFILYRGLLLPSYL